MKKTLMTTVMAVCCLTGVAQNVQIHYDLGHTLYGELDGRPNVTTTFEMYKPDKWGSTFMFTDIDYHQDGAAGV